MSGKQKAESSEQRTRGARRFHIGDSSLIDPSFALSLCRVFAIGCLLIVLVAPTLANPYDEGMRRVRLLSESANVRLLPFGKSGAGRQIPAYVISDFSAEPANKARVMVVAGQHGDEYNPVKSVFTLSRQLGSGFRDDLIRSCVIIVVPMANPDGIAAHTRANASGVDVNRDWIDRRTREAQYIHSIIKAWRPHLIIDAHEWKGPCAGPANCVELARCDKADRNRAVVKVARHIAHAGGLALVRDGSNCDNRLLHRRYALLGYASYLLETAPDVDATIKARVYIGAIEKAAECAASDVKLRAALSPSSASFSLAGVSAYLEPIRTGPLTDPEASAVAVLAVMTAAYCLMMWIIKPLAQRTEGVWSHKYRKCSIDWDITPHPLLGKRSLQPLTSRSWTHRRLRSRYAVHPPT